MGAKEFFKKPALDYLANKELAECSRPKAGEKLPDALPKATTAHKEQFRELSTDELRQSKQALVPPYLTLFRAGEPMIVKKLHSHENFVEWPIKQQEEKRPKTALHTNAVYNGQDLEQGKMGDRNNQTMYNFYTGPKQKGREKAHFGEIRPPALSGKAIPRGASVSAIGGTNVRLHYMSRNQSDYLHATRSFSRGTIKPEGSLV